MNTHTQWISIEGKDARDFLQRLSSTDVKALTPGQGARGFFLTAQGKIKSDFMLWCYGPESFAFELLQGAQEWNSKALLLAIEQMTFAEQFIIAPVPAEHLDCVWFFISPLDAAQALVKLGAPAPLETMATDSALRICHHGDREFGRHWISVWAQPSRLNQLLSQLGFAAEPCTIEQLNQWRIEALRPWIDLEITQDSNPLDLGLFDGIADQKGCYPGQEVIERTVSLGSPARKLCQVRVPSAPVTLPQEEDFGKITSFDPKTQFALTLVKKIQALPHQSLTLKSGQAVQILKVVEQAPGHV